VRILLAQNLIHLPAFGGANKANRLLLRQLAERGHTCTVVAPMSGGNWTASREEFLRFLADRGLPVLEEPGDAIVFDDAGVRVHAVPDPSRLPIHATRIGREQDADIALVPLDYAGSMMVNAAFEAVGPARVIAVVHTLDHLPFGPSSRVPSEAGTRQLRRAGGLLAVSATAAGYVAEWGGMDSVLLRLPVYGPGPHPAYGDREGGAVTLINPSWEKGIGTFLGLARRLPGQEFLAVPTWATTAEDREALAALPNVRLMDPVEDIDEILVRTRVLLMPSVWRETFGMSAVEAMLRGIPVMASDIGGLPEAMLGVPHLLPGDDEDLWFATLSRLLTDRAHYREVSLRARRAAARFAASTGIEEVEAFLRDRAEAAARPRRAAAPAGGDVRARVEELSPAQRRLLAEMLARKARARPGAGPGPAAGPTGASAPGPVPPAE
jgi:glycosyltransferase involved in cell wall biosynthesis